MRPPWLPPPDSSLPSADQARAATGPVAFSFVRILPVVESRTVISPALQPAAMELPSGEKTAEIAWPPWLRSFCLNSPDLVSNKRNVPTAFPALNSKPQTARLRLSGEKANHGRPRPYS